MRQEYMQAHRVFRQHHDKQKALHEFSFVWGDSPTQNQDVYGSAFEQQAPPPRGEGDD